MKKYGMGYIKAMRAWKKHLGKLTAKRKAANKRARQTRRRQRRAA